jgi:hypothetical protein
MLWGALLIAAIALGYLDSATEKRRVWLDDLGVWVIAAWAVTSILVVVCMIW